MSYTKGEIAHAAFSELGFGDYVFDMSPGQVADAVAILDRMMAAWSADGIRLSYPVPSSLAGSDPDQDSNVPDVALEAVVANLAVRVAPGYGKAVSDSTMASAARGRSLLATLCHRVVPVTMPAMPAGAGNKGPDEPFIQGDGPTSIGEPNRPVSFS